MIYRAIGILCNNHLEGMDIVFVEFQENAGKWTYERKLAAHSDYPVDWVKKLEFAGALTAVDHQFLHTAFGTFIGMQLNQFISENNLQFQVALVTSLGVTVYYQPGSMISLLGHGGAIAAVTELPVITDLPVLDVVLGGNGKFYHNMAEKMGMNVKEGKEGNMDRAVCIALAGVFRWREEFNFLSSITGAKRNSIGGSVWLGQE